MIKDIQNTQLASVVSRLENKGSITAEEALADSGCERLPAYIHMLRKQGWQIATKVERRTVYVLEKKPKEGK